MRNKLYIAGPMAGIRDFNYPLFNAVERTLWDDGWDVVNPAALDKAAGGLGEEYLTETGGGVTSKRRAAFLKRDFKELLGCTGIVLLHDWQSSIGANCELLVSHIVGLNIYVWDVKTSTPRWSPLVMPLSGKVRDHSYAVAIAKADGRW